MRAKMELITVIVQRKDGQKAVDAAIAAGAPAATSFYARGTGVRQKLGLVGRFIQAEKEIVLIGVQEGKAEPILEAVAQAVGLHDPGKGFAYVQSIDHVVGFYAPDARQDGDG